MKRILALCCRRRLSQKQKLEGEPTVVDDKINFHRDGFCVLRGVISERQAGQIGSGVSKAIEQHSTSPRPRGYVGGLLRFNTDIVEHLRNPRLNKLCCSLLGANHRVSMITGVVNGPGLERGGMHRDWPHNPKDESFTQFGFGSLDPTHVVTLWMLTDFTKDNGGTIVVPGSHLWNEYSIGAGQGEKPEVAGEHQLLGRAGDVIFMDARTFHSIAPNNTDECRIAVIVRYAPWWLNLDPLRIGSLSRLHMVDSKRAPDPHVPALPRHIYDDLPDDLKPILYSLC